MYFSLITMAGEQVENLEQFFIELPVLVEQATLHLCSNDLKLLEILSTRLDDSVNVPNIFFSRCKELNIPESLTANSRRLLQKLHSIETSILIIIINEHDFC